MWYHSCAKLQQSQLKNVLLDNLYNIFMCIYVMLVWRGEKRICDSNCIFNVMVVYGRWKLAQTNKRLFPWGRREPSWFGTTASPSPTHLPMPTRMSKSLARARPSEVLTWMTRKEDECGRNQMSSTLIESKKCGMAYCTSHATSSDFSSRKLDVPRGWTKNKHLCFHLLEYEPLILIMFKNLLITWHDVWPTFSKVGSMEVFF